MEARIRMLNFYFDNFVLFPNLKFYKEYCNLHYKNYSITVCQKFPYVNGYPKFVKNFENFEEKPQIVIKRSDLKFKDKPFALPIANGIPSFVWDIINNNVDITKKTPLEYMTQEWMKLPWSWPEFGPRIEDFIYDIYQFKRDNSEYFSTHGWFINYLLWLDIPFTINSLNEKNNDKIFGKKWYVIDHLNYIHSMPYEMDLYKNTIDFIKDTDINLMFLTPQEPSTSSDKFYNIIKFCIDRNCLANKIFYLSQDFFVKNKIYKIKPYMCKEKNSIVNNYGILGPAFLLNVRQQQKYLTTYKPSFDLEKINRNKHFYFVVGNPKKERIKALLYFYSENLLNNMNWSSIYPIKEASEITPKVFEDDLNYNICTNERELTFAEVLKDDNYIPKKIVEDSYISIIFEVDPRGLNRIIDEKILKPIISLHPFIIYGNPYTLDYIRDMGFETFPEIFDESYDEIYDHIERLEFVIKQIEKISKLSLDKVHDLYNKVYPKLVKNRDLLLSMDIKKEYESWFEVE